MIKATDFAAVIFDMDGLVLDSESTYRLAWQNAALAMGQSLPDSFCHSLSGLQGKDLEQRLIAHCGDGFDLACFYRQASLVWRGHVSVYGIKVKHGFHALLDYLKKQRIPYGLATNSRRSNVMECLALAGLEQAFPIIVGRDDVVSGKPEPDVFLKAAALLQVPAQRCLVLEDSHAGIVAAYQAEAIPICIPSVPIEPATANLCHAVMADLAEVLSALEPGHWSYTGK